uniref:cytochrome P450 n=1 Tax=Micromonospora acroterricola TaxID=2202421 RepID=UPI001F27CD0E
ACDATAGLIGAAAHHLLPLPAARETDNPPARSGPADLPHGGGPANPPAGERPTAPPVGGRPTAPPAGQILTAPPPGKGPTAPLARQRTVDLLVEVLRLDPPVRATRRVTIGAVRLGGRDLPPGSPVLLRFDAANRDPLVFAEPAAFRPDRPGAGLLTFGAGERGCPGDRHALALAAGVLDVLRERCLRTPAVLRHEPHPTLRVPTSLEVSVR